MQEVLCLVTYEQVLKYGYQNGHNDSHVAETPPRKSRFHLHAYTHPHPHPHTHVATLLRNLLLNLDCKITIAFLVNVHVEHHPLYKRYDTNVKGMSDA